MCINFHSRKETLLVTFNVPYSLNSHLISFTEFKILVTFNVPYSLNSHLILFTEFYSITFWHNPLSKMLMCHVSCWYVKSYRPFYTAPPLCNDWLWTKEYSIYKDQSFLKYGKKWLKLIRWKFSMKQQHNTALLHIKGNCLCEQPKKMYKRKANYYAIRCQKWKILMSLD